MSGDLEKATREVEVVGDELERLLALIPKDKKKQANAIVAVVKESLVAYSGPIPPPEQFAEYERILPGSADRILKMAESQQTHRMALEKEAITKNLDHNKRGQTLGFFAMLLMIGLSVFFVLFDMPTWAGTIGTITIVTLVGLFVTGNAKIGRDLKSKK